MMFLVWYHFRLKYTSLLTHWGRVTHICVCKLTIIGSYNGLPLGRRQAIIWTNAGILLIGPLWTNFSKILIEILIFSFKKMCLKVSVAKWHPFCLGLNVLMIWQLLFSTSLQYGYAPVMVFLRVVITNSLQLMKCVIWIVAMATKQKYGWHHTWSQLENQQSFLLNSTFSLPKLLGTIFSEQGGFGVVTLCISWCLEKNKAQKFAFINANWNNQKFSW